VSEEEEEEGVIPTLRLCGASARTGGGWNRGNNPRSAFPLPAELCCRGSVPALGTNRVAGTKGWC